MWKVLYVGQKLVLAWYIPNENDVGNNLEKYKVPVDFIESKLNDGLGPIRTMPLELKSKETFDNVDNFKDPTAFIDTGKFNNLWHMGKMGFRNGVKNGGSQKRRKL
jgi:hypothetical protein